MQMIIKSEKKDNFKVEIRTHGAGYEVLLLVNEGNYYRTSKTAIYGTEKSAKSAYNRWLKNL